MLPVTYKLLVEVKVSAFPSPVTNIPALVVANLKLLLKYSCWSDPELSTAEVLLPAAF